MANGKTTTDWGLEQDLLRRLRLLAGSAPWALRITEHKDKPAPVFVVKEHILLGGDLKKNNQTPGKAIIKDRGLLYGQSLRRCLPVIRTIIGNVNDEAGIPLDLQRFLSNGRITFRGNLPLDEEAGPKLSLIFKLQERLGDMDRVELIAWRVERFSCEETAYWLTRATQYGAAANRWAQAGMRLMLGGQPGDKAVLPMLEKLRRYKEEE